MSNKARYWCFTLNNPSQREKIHPLDTDQILYMVWQLENGESGTPHLQGYVEFRNTKALTAVKIYNSRAHWEIRKGSDVQARNYCMKEETRVEGPWEQGTFVPATKGQRTDLINLKEKVDKGATMEELCEFDFPTVARYFKFFLFYKGLKIPKRNWKTEVYVFWGEPGSGKSSRARKEAGDDAFWVDPPKENKTFWWDGYEGQENVVLDDFYGYFPWNFILRLLDGYPMKVPVKGNSIQFCAKKIWITSNKPPEQWYNFESQKYEYSALSRRITSIEHFVKDPDFNVNLNQ